jgi:hypothetical protein
MDLIGNITRDLPASSIVPQPNTYTALSGDLWFILPLPVQRRTRNLLQEIFFIIISFNGNVKLLYQHKPKESKLQ